MRPSFLAAAVLCLSTLAAHADTLGLTFTGGIASTSAETRGFEFTTGNAITVTSLGWWDYQGDGLVDSHAIRIWNTAGVALLSGTVSAGTTDALMSGFRFDSALTGVTALAAGTYIIGGLATSGDYIAYDVPSSSVVLGNGISFVNNENNGLLGVLSFPNQVQPGFNDGVFGPSFTFTSNAVTVTPEPSSLVLLGTGLAGMFGVARRKFARS